MLSEIINMKEIILKITPSMIRRIIKEKNRMVTTQEAIMFIELFHRINSQRLVLNPQVIACPFDVRR